METQIPKRPLCKWCRKNRVNRYDAKYCSAECSQAAQQANKKKVPESVQLTFLRKEADRLRQENISLRDQSGFWKETREMLRRAVETLPPLAPVPYLVPRTLQAEAAMGAVVMFSDWHIGQYTNPRETEGFGRFNWQIAQERVAYIVSKILGWTVTHRLAFKIPRLTIFALADFISGDIHHELRITNEFPTPVQSVRAGGLLAQAVATLAPHFPEVQIVAVGADNHSRLVAKPQFKQKATNSFSYVVYEVMRLMLKDHKNIEIVQPESMTHLADVNGQKFLCDHGDTVKAWMGVPYYGMERRRGREAVRRMMVRKQMDVGFDYIACGHWHQPAIIGGNILVNGSLTGTDEYDHGCGRHADPQQVSFLVHPKYGVFDWTPWQPKR